jgi:hypothetical protein
MVPQNFEPAVRSQKFKKNLKLKIKKLKKKKEKEMQDNQEINSFIAKQRFLPPKVIKKYSPPGSALYPS